MWGGDVGPVILDFVTGCNGMVLHPRRCCFTYGEEPSIPIELEAGLATERVWTILGTQKNLSLPGTEQCLGLSAHRIVTTD